MSQRKLNRLGVGALPSRKSEEGVVGDFDFFVRGGSGCTQIGTSRKF